MKSYFYVDLFHTEDLSFFYKLLDYKCKTNGKEINIKEYRFIYSVKFILKMLDECLDFSKWPMAALKHH